MADTVSTSRVKKTRNRIPTSCEHCRKKKMKCDRQKPCSSCVKNKCESLCRYATQHVEGSKNVQLTNEIIKLKMRINKLEKILQLNNIDVKAYDELAFILNHPSTNSSTVQEEQEDPVIQLSSKFDKLVFKENYVLHAAGTSYMTLISGDEELSGIFRKYFRRHEQEYQEYLKAQQVKATPDSLNMPIEVAPVTKFTLGSDLGEIGRCVSTIIDGNEEYMFTRVLDILEQINYKLPPMYVISALVDNFFAHVYFLLPYVDEGTFREEITYVLTTDRRGRAKMVLSHVQNASIISLLLIILRFSYLAVNVKDFSEDPTMIESEGLATMIKSRIVIEEDFISIAKDLMLSLPGPESNYWW
ncbi:unnamed protein product [Ambrosiozyma monospora]|uniref:Unnamed protein product n=1 Tax=Ambrosiozyma monospora TaxID=43982 RepID=A0ACB5SXY3_AMBMO|nr:unnamed protein product [Ambrosiozyma monospora]